MFLNEEAEKNMSSYGLDPLELLRRMLNEYGERISSLEAWRAEMEGKKEAHTGVKNAQECHVLKKK